MGIFCQRREDWYLGEVNSRVENSSLSIIGKPNTSKGNLMDAPPYS